MENCVVTIGRQFGSRGKQIGQKLAEKLGIAFYDKELITLASQESGLCKEFFEKADEQNSGSLLHAFAAGFTFGGFQYNDFLSNEKLFQIQSDVIRKLAEEKSCVIVGRCADYILRENKNCVNVFIHAPLDERVKTVMHRENISEHDASELVRKMDKTRPGYYNYYTDKEWGVASSYHLSIDSSLLGIDRSVDFIQGFVKEVISC
ncbi:cytidylate kinase-like family protein [uncultured Sanguibacteroides sp.]|uniref:cytidylate kinase-like family protein n=1 Tax=uncultured Sanguibacteroides sp. TaxID=1635151 RepID=UPI0025FE27C8|nr:cytidylate kinase-like family protein [uncultured Sanguibacteroides sp.]